MVGIQDIKSQLKDLSRYGPGLVGIFVGGTSGIGETTAREFVRYTTRPRVYIVGRNQDAGDKLVKEFKTLNTESQVEFIKSDVALLRNVDDVCAQIKAKEEKINLLCLSAGIMTLEGRNETAEGLDQKFSLHYYSRMRFTQQLLPLLSAAAKTTSGPNLNRQPLARVLSVLGAGHEWAVNLDDFDLKKTYTVKNCAAHAQTGNTLALQHLAADPANEGITFIHSAPGGVNTNIFRNMPKILQLGVKGLSVVLKPLMVGIQESGERHMYAATADKFGKGGSVLLNPSSDVLKPSAVVEKMTKDGTQDKIWEHTQEVLKKICEEGGKY